MDYLTLLENQTLVNYAIEYCGKTNDIIECEYILRNGIMIKDGIQDIVENEYSFATMSGAIRPILGKKVSNLSEQQLRVLAENNIIVSEGKLAKSLIPLAAAGMIASAIPDAPEIPKAPIQAVVEETTPTPDIYSQDPTMIMALTIWGESRSEGLEGMVAVGNVIANRALQKKFGNGIIGVAKKRKQFSCWNSDDPNLKLMRKLSADDPQWETAYDVASKILNRKISDNTNGATFYHTNAISPYWVDSMKKVSEIGDHIFYREKS